MTGLIFSDGGAHEQWSPEAWRSCWLLNIALCFNESDSACQLSGPLASWPAQQLVAMFSLFFTSDWSSSKVGGAEISL